jgi:uncharacterized protein YlxW (UPF0749 family)
MNSEQVITQVLQNTKDIAAVSESAKSAHKRIDENDRITEGIHKLAANVETLAVQVKMFTDRMDSSIARIEAGQKNQGERIGALEKEPADKWKGAIKQIIELIIAAVFGIIAAKFL